MAATSQEYVFGDNFNVDQLIIESFERIGKIVDRQASELVVADTQAAVRCANLQLTQWAATEDLLFLVQREMFPLITGQAFYELPSYVARVLKNEVTRSNYIRQNTGGTAVVSPTSPSGAPCFNPDTTVGCTQTSPNGWIGYQYAGPLLTEIWYVGILSLIATNYTLSIDYSQDGIYWHQAKQLPTLNYYPEIQQWFVLEQPPGALYWRIRETRGSTLAIQQIFFANPDSANPDITLGNMDRASFLSLSLKSNPKSIPSAYYFNEKKKKSLYLYGNDYSSIDAIVYDAAIYAQSIEYLYQLPDSAVKYLDPLAAAMAYRLALKYNVPLDKVNMLKMDAMETFERVRSADREDVDVNISLNVNSLWDI